MNKTISTFKFDGYGCEQRTIDCGDVVVTRTSTKVCAREGRRSHTRTLWTGSDGSHWIFFEGQYHELLGYEEGYWGKPTGFLDWASRKARIGEEVKQ